MDITVSNGKIQIQNDNNGHVNSKQNSMIYPKYNLMYQSILSVKVL